MSSLMDTPAAMQRAAELTAPGALAELYQQFKENMAVVNAIVQNQNCPDDVKKEVVRYLLDERLPRSLKTPSDESMLAAMKKSIEAWQPVQKFSPLPVADLKDPEMAKLFELAQRKGALILYGPPGTSKTFLARSLAGYLAGTERSCVEFVQFHASYSYEDFIEGIVPKVDQGVLTYMTEDKPFKRFCLDANRHPNERFVFIIDEINRADLSKVLGEVFTSLEYRGEPVRLLYSKDSFTIPRNVIILGTMNTIDLSTTDIDFALRRRFFFFEVAPSEDRLEHVLTDGGRRNIDSAFVDLLKEAFLKTLPIYPLGHAYFKEITNSEDLKELWDYQIRSLLEQYFVTEKSKVKDIERLYSAIWNGNN